MNEDLIAAGISAGCRRTRQEVIHKVTGVTREQQGRPWLPLNVKKEKIKKKFLEDTQKKLNA